MNSDSKMDKESSQIQNFYSGQTIFITGATGFLGKLLLEKLLRSCKDIKRIYILLREKKGKSPEERIKEVYDIPAFEVLKNEEPDFRSRITILEGDLIMPNLGLSETNQILLKDQINCVFHIGATVRFDEKIRRAAYINVRGTRDLLRMAGEMKNIKSFVYVSTAFSNCIHEDIGETLYDPIITGENLLELVEFLDDETLDAITPTFLRDHPNTYTFSKSITEDVVKVTAKNLPTAIVRPSMVLSSYKEPVPGWCDSFYGPMGLSLGVALGLLTTIRGFRSKRIDVVPADFVINAIIAAAWDIATNSDAVNSMVKVFNCVSGPQNPISMGQYVELTMDYGKIIPSRFIVRYPYLFIQPNYYIHRVIATLLQKIPAYIADFVARCMGKQPIFVKAVKKIDTLTNILSYFTMQQWNFDDSNTKALWKKLNAADKKLYNFDIAAMSWREFIYAYVLGGRIYLLKDPIDTVPQGKRRFTIIKYAHYFIVTMLCLLFFKLVLMLYHLCV